MQNSLKHLKCARKIYKKKHGPQPGSFPQSQSLFIVKCDASGELSSQIYPCIFVKLCKRPSVLNISFTSYRI